MVAADSKSSLLNPNWAALQQELKGPDPRPSKPGSIDTENKTSERSTLGKRKERPDTKPPSPGSALKPRNPDCSLTDEIAMDCEMVGVSSQGNKSALGRVTLVNASGNVVYDKYVQPLERVVDFRSEISGIRPHNLKKAKDFRSVQAKVSELINRRILVGHALRNDLKVLLLSHPKKDIRDTSEYQPFLRVEGRKRALRDLAAEFLGIKIQQKEHCPVEDARAAMFIYQKHKKEWERSIKDRLKFKQKQKKYNHKNKSTRKDDTKHDATPS